MTNRLPPIPADADRVVVPSQRPDVSVALKEVVDAVEASGYGQTSAFAIRLALEEAISNAVRHGNQNDPSKTITLDYHISPQTVLIAVADEGTGFDPESVPDPTLDKNLENPSGRGLMLMRAYMSQVQFNDAGNLVVMRYDKPAA